MMRRPPTPSTETIWRVRKSRSDHRSVGEQILLPAKARDARVRERTTVRDRSSKEQQRRQVTKYVGNEGL